MTSPGYTICKTAATSLLFKMVSSADQVTPMPGLLPVPAVQLSKNGGALGAASGVVTELGSGWYKVAGNSTNINTVGPLLLVATAAGAVGSAIYTVTTLSQTQPIDDQVWGTVMGDHRTDDTIGVAMWNVFRGYQATDGAIVGLRLSAEGLSQVMAEAGIDVRQAISLILAYSAGRSAVNPGAGTVTYKTPDGSETRIVADAEDGVRTSVTATPYEP